MPETTTMPESNETQSWPDLAIGLYDRLTGRNAEICYEFEDLEVQIPARADHGQQQPTAPWKLNGVIKIRTRNLD